MQDITGTNQVDCIVVFPNSMHKTIKWSNSKGYKYSVRFQIHLTSILIWFYIL